MAFLTSTDIINLSGLTFPYNGYTATYIDLILKGYEQQINKITGTQFTLTPNTIKDDIRVPLCSTKYLNIGSWQKTPVKPVISKLNAKKEVTKVLIENVDFRFKYASSPNEDGNKVIIALDFGCLGCVCCCDFIKVEGTYGWQDTLPYDLQFAIVEAIKAMLSVGGQVSTGVGNGILLNVPRTVASERSRNLSKSYSTNQKYLENGTKLKQGAKITSILDVARLCNYYRSQTISLFGFSFDSCH